MTVSLFRISEQKIKIKRFGFFFTVKQSGKNYSYCWPVRAHNPLPSPCLYRLNSRVGKIADTLESFKSDTWKHFGLPALRNEKGEKATNEKQCADTAGLLQIHVCGTFSSHILMFKVDRFINGNCTFSSLHLSF